MDTYDNLVSDLRKWATGEISALSGGPGNAPNMPEDSPLYIDGLIGKKVLWISDGSRLSETQLSPRHTAHICIVKKQNGKKLWLDFDAFIDIEPVENLVKPLSEAYKLENAKIVTFTNSESNIVVTFEGICETRHNRSIECDLSLDTPELQYAQLFRLYNAGLIGSDELVFELDNDCTLVRWEADGLLKRTSDGFVIIYNHGIVDEEIIIDDNCDVLYALLDGQGYSDVGHILKALGYKAEKI